MQYLAHPPAGCWPHGFDAGPCLARPSRSPQASGSLIQVLAEPLLCAGLPEEVGQDAACQPLHRTRFRGRLGCDRLSSTSIRYGFRGSDRRLAPAGACGRIDWDRRGSKQQLVCKAVSLTQGAVRRRNGEGHPLVVSLHFDRKRRSSSVRHALLSFARVRMNRRWMWGAVIEPVRRRCGTKKAGSGLACLGLAVRVGSPLFGVGRVMLANQPIQLTKDPPPCLLSQPRHSRLPSLE